MRYLKLTSAKNPENDYILLDGNYFDKDGNKNTNFKNFEGFLCTSFQSIGISRKLEFLSIKNRQFSVDNKTNFKKYSLTIEILSKYSEYEAKHRSLITFLDRNKKDGFRLYFRPYDGMDTRYCLCDIETSVRTEKMQPVILTLSQNSLWLGNEINSFTEPAITNKGNLYSFIDDGSGYYSASFLADKELTNYYSIEFFSGALTEAIIKNNSYNEIPLNIRIYGYCVNPVINLYRKGENTSIKTIEINAKVSEGYYIEIIADIKNSGIWYVNASTGNRQPYDEVVNNENGSPFIYVDFGEYTIKVVDGSDNTVLARISYQEEFSE